MRWVAIDRGIQLAEERGDDERAARWMQVAEEIRAEVLDKRVTSRGEDGLVLRHRTDASDTGFEGKEGTFTICSFWLVTALALIGETDRARSFCEKLLSFASPLALYAEGIDVETEQLLGNFPRAFTDLALIEAVSQVIEAESTKGSQ